jgi:hypothetical protein
MNTRIEFLRRIGPAASARNGSGPACYATCGCPDLFELADGDFAIIGTDITEVASASLPPSAGCAPDERIVRIPRNLLVLAKSDIPEK